MSFPEFKAQIIKLSAFLEHPISDEQVKSYTEWIGAQFGNDIKRFSTALMIYLNTQLSSRPANEKFYTTLAKIKDIDMPQVNLDGEATELVSKILGAVPKFGRYSYAAACGYFGELGKEIVDESGGWVSLCSTLTPENTPTVRAQLNRIALSKISRAVRQDQIKNATALAQGPFKAKLQEGQDGKDR